ncbi:low temperature requirement protein A [Microbacterium luteolum]|uniref:Low temperature requirement protein A n=1 Tax=Microbacterium luteolum TaxID=69367 RepID=A0ABY7XSN1_MICLT|nr:low temperature requirement protein A [Microbacterium luteolum]WDM45099.1 low temperature requirement protein A [Microbacterium luteolum]
MSTEDTPSAPSTGRTTLAHHLTRMTGRDPNEPHRAATPLELLFDLAFVVTFVAVGNEFAHYLADGHIATAIGGFVFVMLAAGWAWINFSWFASAYDTDDWFYRICTLVQMIGVVVLVLGIPALFHSLDEGHYLDNSVLVAGYVVMRVALIAQWLRAARQNPARRRTCLTYAGFVTAAQIGWVALAIAHTTLGVTIVCATLLFLVEFTGPWVAERRTKQGGTPWHAHHIAERVGLLTIIALGEGVFGTVTAVSTAIESSGWSLDAVLLVVAGVGLTFGLWWTYFLLPAGAILHEHREKAFVWGYGHLLVFASIAATGAGLHVIAYSIEGKSELGPVATVVAVALPVLLLCLAIYALYSYLVAEFDSFHLLLITITVIVLVLAVLAAAWGAPLSVSLVLIVLAPFVTVVGYETVGHRHEAAVLTRRLG